MEQFLKKNQVDSVTAIAEIIASTFNNDQAIKTINQLTQSPQQAIYSHQLKNTIVIDGYADDWSYLQDQKQNFYTRKNDNNHSFSVIAANDNRNYYFLVSVNDDDLQYKKTKAPSLFV